MRERGNDKILSLQYLRDALDDQNAGFREGQWEAIDALVNHNKRLLVVQRTGWGKSSVYFIASRILRDRGRGPTLIISPLLALMRNQIHAAEQLNIRALTINSTNTDEWLKITDEILKNKADVVLISPERLANDQFVEEVLLPIAERIGLLVVDEAHCISDWGHDFRPDYRRLVNILKQMPKNIPLLGTTATANNRVIKDAQEQLGNLDVQRGTLMRGSLVLQTIRLGSQAERLAWLLESLKSLPGTGIIYTLTKRDANQVADWLNKNGVSALAYYSDVKNEKFEDPNRYRIYLEEQLMENQIKALVATTALGMGYDKPDLGFVIHYQAPGSIVHYYQQVGRAGRAIDTAYGILLSGEEDGDIQEYFRQSAFPDQDAVEKILTTLEDFDGLPVSVLEKFINLRKGLIEKALKFLSVETPSPVITTGNSNWQRTAVAYKMDLEEIDRLTHQRELEWEEIQSYIDEKGCLMEMLSRALDDKDPKPCGRCSSCIGEPVIGPQVSREIIISAARFLRQSEFALECKKQVAPQSFPEYGFSGNLSNELRAETGRVLSRWRDAGWGQLVADDKEDGMFREELVDAAAEMVQERWKPSPAPEWITCVPSHNQPKLVSDFSKSLADKLNIPFEPVVKKIKGNQPQKLQQNRFHQCHNLDGVFEIESVMEEPVLLIDDVVDSAWTLTIIAALLRQRGSGLVWPFALASTKIGG
jgi:ATP-dependent DNA helicase RecQ